MEIELKYLINDEDKANAIWDELKSHPALVAESLEEKLMHAVYFDAEDERLSKEKIAVRVRREGNEMVATCKWGGNQRKAMAEKGCDVSGALHARSELNVPVGDDSWFVTPPSNIFGDTEIGQRIIDLLGNEPLVPILETQFLRKLVQLHVGDMVCEVAVDLGTIEAGGRWEPICELELELLEGESEPLMELGKSFETQYALIPGEKSKFARGKALRGEK